MDVRVQEHAFDAGKELNDFTARQEHAGAVVSFSGIVRDVPGGLRYVEIEHYPAMTQSALSDLCKRAQSRWDLTDVSVIHRHGQMRVGEQIMMVATAAPHRAAAFEAAEFLMDYLKSRAPFWKKEVMENGETWVEARAEDDTALLKWSEK
ncbi:MAG: molybdenum cofactor biosynthesis protein MoaE [Pseudomonadota bacterium]